MLRFVFIFICFFGEISAIPPLYVSLGGCCEVAAHLRHQHLRTEAYPFDWMLTLNHDKFLKILEEDFKFFLDENVVIQNPTHPTLLENIYYECEFRHDEPTDVKNGLKTHLKEIRPKYERRIERFRKLKSYPAKVFFIRSAYDCNNGGVYFWWKKNQEYITATQAVSLKEALDRYFPELDFTLVIINYADHHLEKISGIKNVIEYQIRKSSRTIDYAKLLSQLH